MTFPPSPPRRKRPKGDVTSLASVLPAVGRNLNLDQKVQEWSVLALWTQVVDPRYAGKSRAVGLIKRQDRTLVKVVVPHAAVASELGFLVESLVARINAFAPETGLTVSGIDLVVDASAGWGNLP